MPTPDEFLFKIPCDEIKDCFQIDLGKVKPDMFPVKSLIKLRKFENCKYNKGDIVINGFRKSGIGNIMKGIKKNEQLTQNWNELKEKFNDWYDPYYNSFVIGNHVDYIKLYCSLNFCFLTLYLGIKLNPFIDTLNIKFIVLA